MDRAKGKRIMGATQSTWGRWATFGLGTIFLAGLIGCIHPISKSVMKTVDRNLAFAVVIQNPRAYSGSIILWGGVIQTVMIGPEETQLIITETPLDSKGRPQIGDAEGEFIAHTTGKLDLEIFHRDMKVTVAGEIDGVEEIKFGPEEYPRPSVRVIEIHAWTGKVWGIFPVTKGWKIDQSGPFPSPFEERPGKRIDESY